MKMIEFNHVSKSYQLGAYRTSLREALAESGRKILRRQTGSREKEVFWALDDVSFDVEEGEVLGIIGHNGAGKSTTLKLLSKVTFPTSGQIHTRGRMAALIELGAGFHPDLTGRENVYLNGSILGLKRDEINESFDKIVEFAEMEQFIDTPVKRYSSGMYVRLAFSVASHVRADLLLVDEVLSVGDMSFQLKCLAKMNELRDSGTTIVFISHNLYSVSSFCRRAILLQHGKVAAEGLPGDVIQIYREEERERTVKMFEDKVNGHAKTQDEHVPVALDHIEFMKTDGNPSKEFSPEEPIKIFCKYRCSHTVHDSLYVVQIRRADGLLCALFTSEDRYSTIASGNNEFELDLEPLHLQPDYYSLHLFLANQKSGHFLAKIGEEPFQLIGNMKNGEEGVILPKYHWR
ncbi:ABC transporter ATP-binding protein [Ornatilinea apprima]|uniref:ABC transporter ATP-binding protein n=1 Tax=Ornatilinea apprima TaxID=1134406 RepID=UPI00094672F1|nr:polysaccharide ABC transporter ATP-binding protein [Ornatilinea apprima]